MNGDFKTEGISMNYWLVDEDYTSRLQNDESNDETDKDNYNYDPIDILV